MKSGNPMNGTRKMEMFTLIKNQTPILIINYIFNYGFWISLEQTLDNLNAWQFKLHTNPSLRYSIEKSFTVLFRSKPIETEQFLLIILIIALPPSEFELSRVNVDLKLSIIKKKSPYLPLDREFWIDQTPKR